MTTLRLNVIVSHPLELFNFFFHLASIIISHYSYDLRFQLKDPCLHSSWRKGIKKKLLPWGCALPFSYTHLIGVYADFYVDFSSSNGLFVEELSKIAIWTFFLVSWLLCCILNRWFMQLQDWFQRFSFFFSSWYVFIEYTHKKKCLRNVSGRQCFRQ